MDFVKRNMVFFGGCTGLLLVALFLAVLIYFESGKLSKAKSQVSSADGQIRDLMYANPVPTSKNVKAAEANFEELKERLVEIREELQKGAYLETSNDGVTVISSILRYISEYKKRLDKHINANSEPAPIKVPDQFAFGFEEYFGSMPIPEGEVVPRLDKQRQILSYILDQLIDANPTSIQKVKREDLENPKNSKAFQIDTGISASVPGVIDTLAFQVVFTGYTPSLRRFLNNLAYFQLPVVVRSVEVGRIGSEAQGTANKIFNAATNEDTIDNKTPIISEIESIFIVTLEFIEVIALPNTEGEVSK